MRQKLHLIPAMIAAIIVAMAALHGGTARAQGCMSVGITNNTACDVRLYVLPIPPYGGIFLTAGASTTLPTPVPVTGVRSAGGNNYLWVPTNLPAPAPQYWVPHVMVPTMGCCVDVYYDPATCQITIYPSCLPFPCQP